VLIFAVQAQALKCPWGRGGLNSINVFHGFPVPYRKCRVGPKFDVLLHASHAALQNLNLKYSYCSLVKTISKKNFYHSNIYLPDG
jgi:hypothetical protein